MNLRPILNRLRRYEGVRDVPYWDGTGRPVALRSGEGNMTVGVGRNIAARPFSDDEIALMLSNDLQRAIEECDRHIPWWREKSETRQQVLLDMMFNMGWGGGRRGLSSFRVTLPLIENGQYHRAAKNLKRSRWARQTGRRAVENIAQLLLNGPVPYEDARKIVAKL